MKEISMNHLPAPTWNWLHVNDRQIALPEEVKAADIMTEQLPDGVKVTGIPEQACEQDIGDCWKANAEQVKLGDQKDSELLASMGLDEIEMSAGKAVDAYVKDASVNIVLYKVESGVKVSGPLRIKYDYSSPENAAAMTKTVIELGENAELNLVCLMTGSKGYGVSDTRIRAAAGAKLNLVHVYLTDEAQHILSTIGGCYEDAAGLQLIEVVTGSSDLTIGCHADLNGKRSYLNIDTGYYMEQDGMLDVNYVARHRGCDTDSRIVVNGALKDRATKNFRGTIDFIKGCKGAKGDEREDILLIDDKVHNRTVPLILCAEEDVEGGHGASIGKLSDEVRFYFQSRGISEEEIVDLMARARIDAVAGRIPDEVTRKLILNTEE
ncbi:MAG: SufD family Fe-S cluster assembly protein [Lachnospiraceae bacterium]|nr:SufD family Fe-S cluster assembly protein [Lachnospiraceae bacterium]